jgi:hypothetical protein
VSGNDADIEDVGKGFEEKAFTGISQKRRLSNISG